MGGPNFGRTMAHSTTSRTRNCAPAMATSDQKPQPMIAVTMPTTTPSAMVDTSSEARMPKRSSLVARACNGATSPLRKMPGAISRVTPTSRGSLYSAAMSGAHSATATASSTPMNADIHSRLRHTRSLRFCAWMIAPVMPKSRISSATPMTAPTIVIRPKSAGVSRRASTIVEIICSSARPHRPPERDRDARAWPSARDSTARSCDDRPRRLVAGPADRASGCAAAPSRADAP